MTLGRFYVVKRIGETNPEDLYNDFYHTTHYIDKENMLPLINYVFSLDNEEFFSFVDMMGLEDLKDRPFELVSLITYLSYRKVDSRKISKESLKKKVTSVQLGDNVQENINNLISIFEPMNKVNDVGDKLIEALDENISAKSFYFVCYNILRYASSSMEYDYTIDNIFYLTSEYIEGFLDQFEIEEPINTDYLVKRFGVTNNIVRVNRYSTIYTHFDMINEEMEGDTIKLQDLIKYSNRILIDTFKKGDKSKYENRQKLITSILKG